MNDSLIFITKDITFHDLKSGKVLPIDIYNAQINSWLLSPLQQLAKVNTTFENSYSMFALELLFFEPHGSYLTGKPSNGKSRFSFEKGYNRFLTFLKAEKKISESTFIQLQNMDFYSISRCGIFHTMTLKSGLLMESRRGCSSEVFYPIPHGVNGIIVDSWNFLLALEQYVESYVNKIKIGSDPVLGQNFTTTFQRLFQY